MITVFRFLGFKVILAYTEIKSVFNNTLLLRCIVLNLVSLKDDDQN